MVFVVIFLAVINAEYQIINQTYVTGNDMVYVKKLYNTVTNESASIVYSVGGRLESLYLKSKANGNLISVLYGHNDNATDILLNPWFKGCALMPWAGRIQNGTYIFYGNEYHTPLNEENAYRNDSLHGFIYNRTMNVSREIIGESSATLELSYRISKELGTDYPGYPFRLEIRINYTLNDTGFHIRVKAKNIEEISTNDSNSDNGRALPFYMGWHPYFRVHNISNAMLILDQQYIWYNLISKGINQNPESATLIPSGHCNLWNKFNGSSTIGWNISSNAPNYYDNGFKAILPNNDNNPGLIINKIIDTDLKNTMMLYQEYNKFKYNQLFTGLYSGNGGNQGASHEMAIAFEPQSGETNSYNTGNQLTVLYPQQTWEGVFGFLVE